MPKQNEPPVNSEEIKAGLKEDFADLLDQNFDKIIAEGEESQVKKYGVPLRIDFDFTDKQPSSEISLKYGGQYFKDKRIRTYGDPNQPEMFDRGSHGENGKEISVEETMKRNKGRQRKKETEDAPEE